MLRLRLAAVLIAVLALAPAAHPGVRPVKGAAPQGLHGFLLRADEPRTDVFSRTPSFAWKPVRGATHYEFQLSTSSVFREGGILHSDSTLTSPAASVPHSLPWITGAPHSLYARVRAVLKDTITPWSKPYGFNMRWPSIPTPLEAAPGLLRWTPVEGATSYDVWLVDAGRIVNVNTNVADQREYYTFHNGDAWIGKVNWRVRAVRTIYGKRGNGLPAASYGPWSQIYTSTNPSFQTGPLKLLGTVSDVDSASGDPHRLMPAFRFTGNTSLYGTQAELFRVYAFTDKDCVNVVFRGAVVGSPAYAPRHMGPLALPRDMPGVAAARSFYLDTGAEGQTFMYDGLRVQSTESDPPATPTTKPGTKPGADPAQPAAGATGATGGQTGTGTGTGTGAGTGTGTATTTTSPEQTKIGAPVDLPDTDWPRGGYYWTVIPVEAQAPRAFTTSVSGVLAAGSTQVNVGSVSGLAAGDSLTIGNGASQDLVTIISISGTTLTVSPGVRVAHAPGEPVMRASGGAQYRDLELPQEACAAGRVMRFGKTSEPALTSSSAPFASGLSPSGRLVTASRPSPSFYGHPLVAWTPALAASAYEVQWSKTGYPFRAEADAETNEVGKMTFSTSTTLPLKPGTWYYRVRGIDYSLPTGAQQMSWSDPVKLVVSRPRFAVVGGEGKADTAPAKPAAAKPKAAPARRTAPAQPTAAMRTHTAADGFSLGVPRGWRVLPTQARANVKFAARSTTRENGFFTNVNVIRGDDVRRGTQTVDEWRAKVEGVTSLLAEKGTLRVSVVRLPAGSAVKASFRSKLSDGFTAYYTQYWLDAGTRGYLLTYTTAASAAARNASVFERSARTFRLTK